MHNITASNGKPKSKMVLSGVLSITTEKPRPNALVRLFQRIFLDIRWVELK